MENSFRQFVDDAASLERVPHATRYAAGTLLFGFGLGLLAVRLLPLFSRDPILFGLAGVTVAAGYWQSVVGYGRLKRRIRALEAKPVQ